MQLPYELAGCFVSPHDDPPKRLFVMTAYADESGHESDNWMFLAGFLGNEDQWKDFVPKWKTALGPQRKSLHMNELRWNRERTKHLLARLGPVPQDAKLTPILSGVRHGDYAELIAGTEHEKPFKGYLLCVLGLGINVLRGMTDDKEMKNERLELILEEQKEYAFFADMALSFIAGTNETWSKMPDGKPRLAKWSFVPKGSTILTDPADYFAFALHERWTNPTSKKTEWCKPILKSNDGVGLGNVLKRATVRRMIQDIKMTDFFRLIEKQMKSFRR